MVTLIIINSLTVQKDYTKKQTLPLKNRRPKQNTNIKKKKMQDNKTKQKKKKKKGSHAIGKHTTISIN